jgi:hypothetical protein
MIQLDEKGYRFIAIQEYKDKYRIEVGRTSPKDNQWYAEKVKAKQWNKEEEKFEFSEKDSNLAIPLGTKEQAIEILQGLLKELTGNEPF